MFTIKPNGSWRTVKKRVQKACDCNGPRPRLSLHHDTNITYAYLVYIVSENATNVPRSGENEWNPRLPTDWRCRHDVGMAVTVYLCSLPEGI